MPVTAATGHFLDGIYQDLYSIPGAGVALTANTRLVAASTYNDPISWPFLPVPDLNGQLSYTTLEQCVRDAGASLDRMLTGPMNQRFAVQE